MLKDRKQKGFLSSEIRRGECLCKCCFGLVRKDHNMHQGEKRLSEEEDELHGKQELPTSY